MAALRDKVAIVTGASGGIGSAIALRLAADGARVIVHYGGSADAAQEVVSEIEGNGGEAVAVQAKVGEVSEVRALIRSALENFGQLDILVNNVGIASLEPFSEVTEETYEETFDTNVKATFFGMQEAARHMSDGGRIINISSSVTTNNAPSTSVYAASKAAMEQFTAVVAQELGERGITVNAVLPGPTRTETFLDATTPEGREQYAGMSPLGRLGEPEDIADVVAFLASEESRWLTGQALRATGGIS